MPMTRATPWKAILTYESLGDTRVIRRRYTTRPSLTVSRRRRYDGHGCRRFTGERGASAARASGAVTVQQRRQPQRQPQIAREAQPPPEQRPARIQFLTRDAR